MSSFFGITSASDMSAFAGMLNTKSTSSASDSGDAVSGLLSSASSGDLALIRSGAYKKLLSAYYKKQSSVQVPSEDKAERVKLSKANSDAKSLSDSVKALSTTDFTEDNRADIKEKLKSLIKDYNDVIDSASEVEDPSVLRNALWMTQNTAANAGLLKDVGITIGKGNKLSLDEAKFDAASMNTMKTLFSGFGSFIERMGSKADGIASNAIAAVTGTRVSASAYSSKGKAYETVPTKSVVDDLA